MSTIPSEIVEKALSLSQDEWEGFFEYVKEQGDPSAQEASSYLSSLSVWAGELSEYLMWRGAAGTGDHGHAEALKKSKKRCKELRKANGYSYP